MAETETKVSTSSDTEEVIKKEPKVEVKVAGKLSEKATRGTLDKR
tara:strand:+ start:109 stop:243 length:135 start_codon:yes stop_codon:yes gene_type:complete